MQLLVHEIGDQNGTDEHPVDARIAAAVAEAKGVDPLDLEPMYDVVDADALDAAVRSMRAEGRITFEYEGFAVAVTGDGRIDIDRQS